MSRLPESRNAKLVVCLLLLALTVPAASMAEGCTAETSARLERTDHEGDMIRMEFAVELSTQAECAKILFDLVIEEQLPNGQTKKIRKPNLLTLNDGSLVSVQRHEMPRSHQMIDYEAKIVSCVPCGEA